MAKRRVDQQPDFSAVFFSHFAGAKRVRYELRWDNFRHDLIFMSSLVHDARFRWKDVRIRGKRLTIPLERDRWEIWDGGATELQVIRSKLTFAPIVECKATQQLGGNVNPDAEMWIDYLWADERSRSGVRENFAFYIVSEDWRIAIEAPVYECTIRLQDE